MDHDARSLALIAPYLDHTVHATVAGAVFDDTDDGAFTLRFAAPATLRDEIAEEFTDESELEPWCTLSPVAAVSMPERAEGEFAWVFLDWSHGDAPRVRVATRDNWEGELGVERLDDLHLAVVEPAGDD